MTGKIKIVLMFLVCVPALVFFMAGCQSACPTLAAKYYYTQTEDGKSLAFRRYQPSQLDEEKLPVILCHGLSYNMTFWDLQEEVSLAWYLAGRGYDVWSLSLRGAAPSSQPLNSSLRKLSHFRLEPEMFATVQNRVADLKMTDWSVDDHIRYDLPAAIHFVQQETKQPRVHWIGHSMGGMVMAAYLGQSAQVQSEIKTFVGIGVPVVVFHPLSDPMAFLLEAQTTLGVGSHIFGSSAPATWGVIFGDLGTPTDKLFYNSENISGEVLRGLFHQTEEEISPSQLRQLLDMVQSERFRSLDQKIDYTANLNSITVPCYFIAGTVDNLATASAVKYLYRQVGSGQKKFSLFGRVNSQKNDYGHDDLVIGKHARGEIYPTLAKWLDRFPRMVMENPFPLQPGSLPETKQNEK